MTKIIHDFLLYLDNTWVCPVCTLKNSSNKSCNACNTSKEDIGWTKHADRLSVPNSPTHKTWETVGVEAKRIRDENQAKKQWKNIVEICSQVVWLSLDININGSTVTTNILR